MFEDVNCDLHYIASKCQQYLYVELGLNYDLMVNQKGWEAQNMMALRILKGGENMAVDDMGGGWSADPKKVLT